jgi:myo-inositol-1(or 4)-monophosphatase
MHPFVNIAIRAAHNAARVIVRYYGRTDIINVNQKSRNDFVTDVDRQAEQIIINELRSKFPNHGILAEESGQHQVQSDEFVWIIDPLDGTTNYLHGVPQFAISIALQYRGRLEHGVIYDPLRDELFTASHGDGALVNDRRMRVSQRPGLEGALLGTGFPFRDKRFVKPYLGMFEALLQDTSGIRRPGSAALDLAYVAAGRNDGFWELGLSPWDFAAGVVLIREAGGVVTDLAGGEDFLRTGNLIAGGYKVHAEILQTIQPHLSSELSA